MATRGLAASASATVSVATAPGAAAPPGAATPAGCGWARLRRLFGRRRRDVRLGLRLRLVLALVERPGVEILPAGHHQDRQGDGEKEVSRVLGVHGRLSLPFGVVCGRRPAAVSVAAPNGAEGLAQILDERGEARASASRRAIST